jgi:glutaredoxin/uncharacterized membrane protein
MEKDNTTTVLTRFVKQLDIPVTKQSISDQLEKHPDYDSLLAYSDVLDYYRIPNAAYKLNFEQLAEVPVPFIAHLSGRRFGVVTRFDDKKVIMSDEKWNNKTIPISEFKKQYSGSVLIAEKDNASGEADYAAKHQSEMMSNLRLPVALTGALLTLLVLLFLHTDYIASAKLPIVLLTIFKTAGLLTSVMLLIQSIDTNNPLIQKFCGGDNNKDCNAILSSKAAKVNAWLSWSEVGFFYFAGTWLVLVFNSKHTALIQSLALLNVVSLPYTVYSIYYQWRVAKQWCVFCCAVQGLLWLEFFAFLPFLLRAIQMPNAVEWSSLLTGMVVPVIFWMLAKPYLLQAKQISPLKRQLRTFKYNKDLFEKMMQNEIKYALPPDEHSLIIGNREAETVITMVSNPYCQPCARAHKALDEWLTNRPDIKLQVIFSTENNEKDRNTKIAAHLLTLKYSQNDTILKKALNDWYEQKQKNYEAWAEEHPAESMIDTHEQLEAQKAWCKLTEIKATPTLFLNGRRLPKTYQTEDLKYFI